MRRSLVFPLAGLLGQLVDGAPGMAFGVTSRTVLLSSGINPAASSASVHLAEIGTTFTSGPGGSALTVAPIVRPVRAPARVSDFVDRPSRVSRDAG